MVSDASYQVFPGRKIFLNVFTIYMHGSYLGHLTSIMIMIFVSLYLNTYIQNSVEHDPFLRKASFNFHV